MTRRVKSLREKLTKPCGESSPFQDFVAENPEAEAHDPDNITVDVTRDYLPSAALRDGLLARLHALVPTFTDRQKRVFSLMSAGHSFEQIARIIGIKKASVQTTVQQIRKKVGA